jgi:hypothetical protein
MDSCSVFIKKLLNGCHLNPKLIKIASMTAISRNLSTTVPQAVQRHLVLFLAPEDVLAYLACSMDTRGVVSQLERIYVRHWCRSARLFRSVSTHFPANPGWRLPPSGVDVAKLALSQVETLYLDQALDRNPGYSALFKDSADLKRAVERSALPVISCIMRTFTTAYRDNPEAQRLCSSLDVLSVFITVIKPHFMKRNGT